MHRFVPNVQQPFWVQPERRPQPVTPLATKTVPPTSKTIMRGQQPSEEPTATLRVPTPEELGIRLGMKDGGRESTPDWSRVRRQLDELGVIGFQLEKRNNGYRFVCQLPSGTIDGTGATETEAVNAVMARMKR